MLLGAVEHEDRLVNSLPLEISYSWRNTLYGGSDKMPCNTPEEIWSRPSEEGLSDFEKWSREEHVMIVIGLC